MSTIGPFNLSSEEIEEFTTAIFGLITHDLTFVQFTNILKGSSTDNQAIDIRLAKLEFFSEQVFAPIKELIFELKTQQLALNDKPRNEVKTSREQIISQVIETMDNTQFNGMNIFINISQNNKRKYIETIYDEFGFLVGECTARINKPTSSTKVATPKDLEAALTNGSATSAKAAASSSSTNRSTFSTQAAQSAASASTTPMRTATFSAQAAKGPAKPAPLSSTPLFKGSVQTAAKPVSSFTPITAKPSAPGTKAAAVAKPAAPAKPTAPAAKPTAPAAKPTAPTAAASAPNLIFSKPSAQALAAEAMAHRLAKPAAPASKPKPFAKAK